MSCLAENDSALFGASPLHRLCLVLVVSHSGSFKGFATALNPYLQSMNDKCLLKSDLVSSFCQSLRGVNFGRLESNMCRCM